MPLLPKGALSQYNEHGESTQTVKQRVLLARNKQLTRNNGKVNSELSPSDINKYCHLSDEDNQFLEQALIKLGLSARAWHRILKVSRTIADLDDKKI